MKVEIINAVLARGNHVCAWCACKLNTGRVADQGVVCCLDTSENDSSMVASCVACMREFHVWFHPLGTPYNVENARRILGRCDALKSAPFCDYLDRVCKFDPDAPERMKKGLLTPFSTALARIEAQRNLPLDLRRTRAA